MKILVFGAGVIGSYYAALFAEAGFEVSLYARGARLQALTERGLIYRKKDRIKKAELHIVSKIDVEDRYDFIFLCVKSHQVHEALRELRDNVSPNIVTFVNTTEAYSDWEELCGKGRIIPAFPGAGGGFRGSLLEADLTPRIVQPTSFGEIDGRPTRRLEVLRFIFKKSRIPCQVISDMQTWQLCHLAMVVPLAEVYYQARNPEEAGKDYALMQKAARQLITNFRLLKNRGLKLSPKKMNLFLYLQPTLLAKILSFIYQTEFAQTFMYRHSLKAPDEMKALKAQYEGYCRG